MERQRLSNRAQHRNIPGTGRVPRASDCLGHLDDHFLCVLNLLKPVLPVSTGAGYSTLSYSIKYNLELEGEIARKEFKRSLNLSPY